MRSILIIPCLILSLTTSVDAAREIEPNNHWLQATLIDGSEPVAGVLDDERDFFKLLLPETGEVTVTLDKYPGGGGPDPRSSRFSQRPDHADRQGKNLREGQPFNRL